MTKPRIVVLIPNWNQLPDDYEVHQKAKQLGWYSSYSSKVLEVPGFRPVDDFSKDGRMKRQGPWVVSEQGAKYVPEFRGGGYYQSIHTCIVDYQPLPEAENSWVPTEANLSTLNDEQLADMGFKPEHFSDVRNRESVGV